MADKENMDLENNESTENEDIEKEQNLDNNIEAETEDEALNKIKELEDQYKRLLAEFDNYRKRTEKEKFNFIDLGATTVLFKILPVVDNFERAMSAVPDDLKDNAFVTGVDNIYKQLMKVLEDLGVKAINALSEKFDANLHNAVMMDEESDAEEGTITEELQKGYMYKDEVLRHSMVKVKK